MVKLLIFNSQKSPSWQLFQFRIFLYQIVLEQILPFMYGVCHTEIFFVLKLELGMSLFIRDMSQPSSMFVAGDISLNNLGCIFLGHPVQKLFLNTTHPQYHWSPLSAHPLLWNMFPTYCHYSALSSCGHPQRFFLWNNLFSEYGVSSQCMEGCIKF